MFKAPNLLTFENKFTPATKKKIDRILQTIRRVRLSSDTNLNFLSLQIVDSSTGYQITSTRFFDDVLRILAGSISITDFQLRTMYTESPSIVDFSPLVKKEFIKDIVNFYKKHSYSYYNDQTKTEIQKIIDAHFLENTITVDKLASFFNIKDLDIKNFSSLNITEQKQIIINQTDMLFFIKIKEISHIKEKYEDSGKMDTIKAKNNYAILLKTSYNKELNSFKITEIYRLKPSKEDRSTYALPSKYKDYFDYKTWKNTSFWVEDMNVEIMLARQIAKRTVKEINRSDKKDIDIKTLIDSKTHIKFIINDDKNEYDAIIQKLNEQLFIVCKKYDFYDFKTMSFFDQNNKLIKQQTIDKKIFKSRGILYEAFGSRKY